MKKLFIVLLCISIYHLVSAQSDTIVALNTPSVNTNYNQYKHEIGIETSAFFSQIFRLFGLVKDTQRFPVAPYTVSYKYRVAKKGAIRAGLGMSFNKNTDRLGDFADSKIVSQHQYDARIGYEIQNRIDNRWLVTLGVDVSWQNFRNIKEFDSGFDKALRILKSRTYGIAAVFGTRYDFSQRIGLGVEMSLALTTSKSTEKDEFTANPQFNKTILTSSANAAKFYLPASMFLSYRF